MPIRPLGRRSPFAYPNRRAGVDWSHPASRGMQPNYGYSGVASGANFVNLLTGKPGTKGAAPTAKIDAIGPAVNWSSHTASTGITVTGQQTTTPTTYTFAGIFRFLENVGFHDTIISPGGGNFDGKFSFGTKLDSANGLFVGANGAAYLESTAIRISLNTPYFVAASKSGGNSITFIAVNLATGAVQIDSGTYSATPVLNATLAIGYNGVNTGSGSALGGNLAAVMWSPTGLREAALRSWGDDPWAFWYPRRAVRPDLTSSLVRWTSNPPETIAEAASATDAPAAAVVFPNSVSEAAAATDGPAALLVRPAPITEAAAATDAPASVSVLSLSVTEAATAAGAPQLAQQGSVVESATATDTPSALVVFVVSVADPAIASDTTTGLPLYPASLTESAVAADYLSQIYTPRSTWVVGTQQSETWTQGTKQNEAWAERTKQSEIWTTIVGPT